MVIPSGLKYALVPRANTDTWYPGRATTGSDCCSDSAETTARDPSITSRASTRAAPTGKFKEANDGLFATTRKADIDWGPFLSQRRAAQRRARQVRWADRPNRGP